MRLKEIVYTTVSAILLIYVHLMSTRLIADPLFYLAVPNTLVLFISIYRGRKLLLYKVFGYTALINFLFIVYTSVVSLFFEILSIRITFQNWIWYLQIISFFVGILLAWYLQISLYFLKNKNSNIKSV